MVSDWSSWVHRRNEQVSFNDANTRSRSVRVEFTLPTELAPAQRVRGTPMYYIPITLMHKRRINNLVLRDEGGASLPILTQHLAGAIGAAALLFSASVCIAAEQLDDCDDDAIESRARLLDLASNEALAKLLRTVSSARHHDATEALMALKRAAADHDHSLHVWAEPLMQDADFVALATDLASGYLIVCPSLGQEVHRRIVTLSYEERSVGTPLQLPSPVRRFIPHPGLAHDHVEHESSQSHANFLRSLDEKVKPASWSWRTLTSKYKRFVRWEALRIEVPALSVGRGECYHLEIVIPEGLLSTRAVLGAYNPRAPDEGRAVDWSPRSSPRAHVHLANVPQSNVGVAVIAVRPRVSAGIRMMTMHAAVIAAALLFIAVLWDRLDDNPAPTLAVLLSIVGLVSLYNSRASESQLTTEVLWGVRCTAGLSAATAFGAAAIIAGAKSCTTTMAGVQVCEPWKHAPTALAVLAVIAGVLFLILLRTLLANHLRREQSEAPPRAQGVRTQSSQTTA